MKKRTMGSRAFTKTERLIFDDGEFEEARKNNPLLGTLEEKLQMSETVAYEVLDALPQYAPIYLVDGKPYEHIPHGTSDDELTICYEVSAYVRATTADEDADSPERLAIELTSLVKHIRRMLEADKVASSCLASFALGVAFQKLMVVNQQIRGAKKSASAPRKKQWAMDYAQELREKYSNYSGERIWNCIPSVHDRGIWKEGEKLTNGTEVIAKSTFKQQYLAKVE